MIPAQLLFLTMNPHAAYAAARATVIALPATDLENMTAAAAITEADAAEAATEPEHAAEAKAVPLVAAGADRPVPAVRVPENSRVLPAAVQEKPDAPLAAATENDSPPPTPIT